MAVVQTGSAITRTGQSCTVPLSSPATAGNRLILLMSSNKGPDEIVVPTGWTLDGNGTIWGANLVVASKAAAGGETEATFTTVGTNTRIIGGLIEASGVGSTAPQAVATETTASPHTVGPITAAGFFVAVVGLKAFDLASPAFGDFTDGFTTHVKNQTDAGSNNIGQVFGTKIVDPSTATDSTMTYGEAVGSAGLLLAYPYSGGTPTVPSGSATGTVTWTGTATGSNGPAASGYLGHTVAHGEAITDIVLDPPPGIAAGDTQIVVVGVSSTSEDITAPTGWTLDAQLDMDKGGGQTQALWVFKSTSDTGTATFTKSGTLRDCHAVRLGYARDFLGTGEIQVNATAGTSHPLPDKGTAAGETVLGIVFSEDIPGQSHSAPTGWNLRYDAEEESDNLALGIADLVSPGGTVTGSFDTATAVQSQTYSIVLSDAPAAPPASGSASGTVTWTGTASGTTPAVGPNSGSATGTVTWTGTATGSTQHAGAADGTVTWTGTAYGTASPIPPAFGSATGTVVWTGTASGNASGPRRNLRIVATTPPVSGWVTTDPAHPIWPTTKPQPVWVLGEPETDWQTSEPVR